MQSLYLKNSVNLGLISGKEESEVHYRSMAVMKYVYLSLQMDKILVNTQHIPAKISSVCMMCSRLREIWGAFQLLEIIQRQEGVKGGRAGAKNFYQIPP